MNKTNFTFLPERIRQARMIRGITQSNLADLLGVSTQAISQYELGSNNPKPEILDKMCKVLDLSWNYFITPMPATDITDNPVFSEKIAQQLKRIKKLLKVLFSG